MNLTFRTIRKFISPPWLHEGEGGLIGYSLDQVKDAFMERAFRGRLSHFPHQGPDGTPAPADALAQMGSDRRIFRGIFDTDRQYADKLIPFLDNRKTTGSPLRLLRSLKDYLGPLPSLRTVDDTGNWFSKAADGTETWLLDQQNWNWDGKSLYFGGTFWSRFWVIIYPNSLWSQGDGGWNVSGAGDNEEAWGETANPDGTPLGWGATITIEQVATLRAIVKDEFPGGTHCVNIILAFDPDSFDPAAPEPDGTWGDVTTGTVGELALLGAPPRLATARYLDGVR